MNIPPLNPENSFQIPKSRPKQARTEPQGTVVARDTVKSEYNIDSLLSAMRNDPDVRAEMVEYGKRLAADQNYPPPEMFPKLAELIIKGSTK